MGRNILAVVIGLFLAVIVIMAVEWVSSFLYPLPAGLDPYDAVAMRDHLAKSPIPAGALLIVALGWFLGAAVGTWFAVWMGRRAPAVLAAVLGGLILASSVANMLMLPHPSWFWPVGLAASPLGAYVGMLLGRRPRAAV
jgi:hypothetical protein